MERTENNTEIIEEESPNIVQEPEPEPVKKPKVKRERTQAQIEAWKKLVEKRDVLNTRLKAEKKERKAMKKSKWECSQEILLNKMLALEEQLQNLNTKKEEPVIEQEIEEQMPEPPPLQRKTRFFNPTDRLTLFEHLL
jgi:hypothetical protein